MLSQLGEAVPDPRVPSCGSDLELTEPVSAGSIPDPTKTPPGHFKNTSAFASSPGVAVSRNQGLLQASTSLLEAPTNN